MKKEQGALGILVGGGPAPGLNGVIAAVTIEARRHNLKVYGIYDGYKWLAQDDPKKLNENVRELRISDVSRIHYSGGSILRTSRTNPLKVPNGIKNAVQNLQKLGIRYMVTIGGDDTAFGASSIAKATKSLVKFAHVPKTIDNDLPLPNDLPTFGYETARDLGAVLVKNMMEEARTTGRWYIVVAMGRYTGHLALGIAKSAGATLAIIAEEFGKQGDIPINHVADVLETAIIKRRAMGHQHGVLVIAEGVAERFTEADLFKAAGHAVGKDSYGHILLADVELGKIIKREVEQRFEDRQEKFRMVEINIGYVLRCADPIPFDQEYTRDLGYHAVHYLLSNRAEDQADALICVENGRLTPIKFEDILDSKTGKTAIRYVDINSDYYRVARSYMLRLEKRDLEDKKLLALMAKEMKMTPSDFAKRFKYLVD
ncbi:MAG TPA: diphosphate--fructose-6-phosphate 1-phosphotransferase [bacterium]|nr:diphosphate--fructose-6-phosphate 1-phosphotransferase [bacterium]HOX85184.1 diphosphate--fructose-6-phosphate 1-phosphotransferase [bacterium]HPG44343.1 diphosphate--fructose-6-phosphate 1-phosphotransferase [bacterium]HPM96901.1 diphosphate--fructose-6-phosphate 1-phosphotransferase [bacterium]